MNVKINDLPEEVLVLIFGRFDLLEKLKLRLICLKWKRIIEGLKITEVSIVDSRFNRRNKRNWTNFQSVSYQNLLYYNPSLYQQLTSLFGVIEWQGLTGSLKFISKHPMFFKVRSMFISLSTINDFCFEKYINSHFPQLEQLSCLNLNQSKQTCLSLPKLKMLSFLGQTRPNPLTGRRIRLKLPSMYKLVSSESLGSFEFVHPQSVTHLFLMTDHKSIVRLVNLEYFSCHQLLNESITFSCLTKLKEIHLYKFSKKNAKKRLASINQARINLGRYELKMFVNDIEY